MAENFNAFTEGVALGGLRTKNEIRVLLCYLLKNISAEISKSGLNEIIQSLQLINFFEVNSALASLAEAGLVRVSEHDGDEYYSLAEAGGTYADRLDTDIPINVREAVVRAAVGMVAREKMRGSADAAIEKLDRGYHVILTIRDQDEIMQQTTLYAADILQAETLGERFMEAPEKLYAGIIDLLS